MSDIYKIQCPNCHAVYKVNLNQLTNGNKKARCGNCKSQFVMKDNLVIDTLTKSSGSNKPTTQINHNPMTESKSDSANNKKTNSHETDPILDKIEEDGLIHDDMFADEELDDPKANGDVSNLVHEWSEESLIKASRSSENDSTPGFFKDVAEEETDDESWLESLLREEDESANNPADSESQQTTSDVSLGALLDDLGVSAVDSTQIDQEQSKKLMMARLTSNKSTNNRLNSKKIVINLLWTLACVILLVILCAQYIFFNIDRLVKDPSYYAKLQSVCEHLTCRIPSADLSSLVISNETFAVNKTNPKLTDIIAAITNTSNEAQLYPALKVKIYADPEQTQLIGEFIANPDQYLVVPQRLIGSERNTLFMLTIPIPSQNIKSIDISPMY